MKSPRAIWRNALPEGITSQVQMSPRRHTTALKPWATRAERLTLDVPSRESCVVLGLFPALSSGAQISFADDGPGSSDASTSGRALLALGGCSAIILGSSSSTTYGGCVGSSRADELDSALWVDCSGAITSNTALRGFCA